MKMYRCRFPNCGELLTESGFCPQHQASRPKPFASATRPNEEFYKSARWRKLRGEILKANPFCIFCFKDTDLQVHHLVPPRGKEELFFDPGNLRVVCAECHRKITAAEIMARNDKK